jgi:pimeloyl-ACP methyl ester carboxylesterase
MSFVNVGNGALEAGIHEVSVDGVRQVYHVAGRGPVCVAHSGGPGLAWEYLRSAELEERFTMVYLEPVGTGRSGRLNGSDDYRLDTYVRFLAAVVDHLGEPRVHVLGHSHGGFVVQKYALAHPDRIAGLILYSTSPETGPDFWADAMAGVAAYPQRHPDVAEADSVPMAFQRAVAAPDDDTLSRAFAETVPVYFADFWSRRAEFAPFQAAIRMWKEPAAAQDPSPFDVRAQLGELTMPVVVIAGRHDFICGLRWATMLMEGIPGAKLRVLEKSGHFGHVEQPAEFVQAAVAVLPE